MPKSISCYVYIRRQIVGHHENDVENETRKFFQGIHEWNPIKHTILTTLYIDTHTYLFFIYALSIFFNTIKFCGEGTCNTNKLWMNEWKWYWWRPTKTDLNIDDLYF